MTALLRLPELEKYELLEEIGHGGMATVYRARDRRLGREVAVKLIHRHLRDRSEVAERFAREATAVAKLRHRNIVEVYDVSDPDEGERYLVVELVRGQTLRQRLQTVGAVAPEVAAAVALEIGAGLAHAHRQGVIHRDVKPENVLIELRSGTNDGAGPPPVQVKLADFGIAKLLDAQGVTSTGEVLGSPAHMAPEQIEGGEVGPRTDVFALGVLLYECMVGVLPFQGEHPAQTLRRVLEGEFVLPDRRDARVGAGYSRVVARALSRDPAKRFANIDEFSEALRTELGTLGFGKLQPLLDQLMQPDPGFEADLCSRLVERGTRARSAGMIGPASDCFGRALAYRPGDRALLRRVSGLERRRLLGQLGRWAGLAAAVAGAALLFWRAQPVGDAAPPEEAAVEPAAGPARQLPVTPPGGKAIGARVAAGSGAVPSGAVPSGPVRERNREPGEVPATSRQTPSAAARAPDSAPGARRTPVIADPPPVAGPADVREVVVRITGAMGGTLQIDGTTVPWFGGARHSLALGPHRFAFVTPDSGCCLSTERTVEVVAGEGPQTVIGEIPFRDATLRIAASASRKGYLTCPTLFSGNQRFPGQRTVTMSQPRTSGDCVLREDAPGAAPSKQAVPLRAGETTVIQWP